MSKDISTGRTLSEKDYVRAFELWPTELLKRALNTQIEPNWLRDGTDRFWYKYHLGDGWLFVLVDPASLVTVIAFDHVAIAQALSELTGADMDAMQLPIEHLQIVERETRLSFIYRGQSYSFDTETETLTSPGPVGFVPPVRSPDGRHELFVKDHNLWARDIETDTKWPLSRDGECFRNYASMFDHDRMAVLRARGFGGVSPVGVSWAPDGQQVLCFRTDERAVQEYVFLESVPQDGSFRPIAHSVKMPFAGDHPPPTHDLVLLSADGKANIELTYPENWGELRFDFAENGVHHWSADQHYCFTIASTSDRKRAAIVRIDRQSGYCKILFDEACETFFDYNSFDYHHPNVEFLSDDKYAIWYSQKSGTGQLYLIDLDTGKPARQITEGQSPVFDLIRCDEANNAIYFLSGGRADAENPYHRHLCRCDLFAEAPGSGFQQITQTGYDHAIAARPLHMMGILTGTLKRDSISPSGAYFVDNCSRIDLPTTTSLMRITGESVGAFCSANIEGLTQIGWQPPAAFSVSIDESDERVWGLIIRPRTYEADNELPVIERIYAGPQMIAQPRSFHEVITGNFIYGGFTLAEFGFAVVIADTPGTPYRSKAWHDHPYGTSDRLNVKTHAQVIRKLIAQSDDLSREKIGVNGHSWGGHASAMAMLLAGETYKVGVSSAGIYDPYAFFTDANEKALGRPIYSNGTANRGTPDEVPENYAAMAPSTFAENLQGRFMLAYGDLDENAVPASALRFAASLQNAGKSFELLYLPGANHSLFGDPYFQKRMMDFFIQNLTPNTPDWHYMPKAVPAPRMLI
ncbi:MAG: prolyl oligopeptidase family serine peptidase [Henriciella sp.]|nr:prolyl oligopeptidase family serine peptidase [Henriciella sp.]